jgi:hypothetical protein
LEFSLQPGQHFCYVELKKRTGVHTHLASGGSTFLPVAQIADDWRTVMRKSIAKSIAESPIIRADREILTESRGTIRTNATKTWNYWKKAPKKRSHCTPRDPGIGEGIIRADKCRNSRENDRPLFPKAKKTPNLACCAGGKKSATPEKPEKNREISCPSETDATQKSGRNQPAMSAVISQVRKNRMSAFRSLSPPCIDRLNFRYLQVLISLHQLFDRN